MGLGVLGFAVGGVQAWASGWKGLSGYKVSGGLPALSASGVSSFGTPQALVDDANGSL